MSADTTYNGYANYQTWAVAMFMDGNYTDPHTAAWCMELVRDTIGERNDAADRGEQPFYRLYVAEALENWVKHQIEDVLNVPSLASDLLGHALASVDFQRLAELKIEESKEDRL